jgi:diaminopimelate decarboxylase
MNISNCLQYLQLRKEISGIFYDKTQIEKNISDLRAAYPSSTLHCLAIKASPLPALLKLVCDNQIGLEAASFEEVMLARSVGCSPNKILFDSPVKTQEEINEALAMGVWINANHLQELERIESSPFLRNQAVGLRLNPEIGRGSISTTGVSNSMSKFGIPISDGQSILNAFSKYPFLRGIHIHIGSPGYE